MRMDSSRQEERRRGELLIGRQGDATGKAVARSSGVSLGMELGLDGSQFVGWESGHTLWCACVQRRSSKENRYFSSPVIYQHIVGAQKLDMEFVNHIAVA